MAFPTDTVFGLGADATNDEAVLQIFAAKGRPADNPLIVHLAKKDDIPSAASEVTESAEILLSHFSPGPLTVVLPKNNQISRHATAGLDSVAIRIPDSSIAREIIHHAGRPVAAPSANISGRPSPIRWQSALEDLNGRVAGVFCENIHAVGLESTVVDCRSSTPVVLRPGSISLQQIQRISPTARLADETATEDDAAVSPGTRHPHYQPKASVRLFQTESQLTELLGRNSGSFSICGLKATLSSKFETSKLTELYESPEEYAANYYEFLRRSDSECCEVVFVQFIDKPIEQASGLEYALRDRQLRSAAK